MNLYLRKYIKEFLDEAITRGRTGQRVQSYNERSPKDMLGDESDLELQGDVGLPDINPSDIREGREVPVIIGIINDLDAKYDDDGFIDEDTKPQKYFLGFCRPEFFRKYYDEAFSDEEMLDWHETFSADSSIGMANWTKKIVDLDMKFVYIKLSDVFGEFDAGNLQIKYDEIREELKAELNKLRKEAKKVQRSGKDKKKEGKLSRAEGSAIKSELDSMRNKIYSLESRIDNSKEEFRNEVNRINNDPQIQGSLRDLKAMRKTSFVQGSGQRRVSATSNEALRLALKKYGLAYIACEIINAEIEDKDRLVRKLSNNFDKFRFYDALSDLGFTTTAGEAKARDILKHSGLGIRDNIDQFAVSSEKEAIYYSALGAEEELDDYIKYVVIDDDEGRGLFGDNDLEKVGSFAFAGYLKDMFLSSKYYNEYISKIPDSIEDPLLPDVKSLLSDKEKEGEAFEEFIEDLRSPPLEKSFTMFKTALCSIYKNIMNDPRSKDVHPIKVEISVDSQGKITNLNDHDKAGVCKTLKSDLQFKFLILTMIAARNAKEAAKFKKGISDAPRTGQQTRSMQGDMGVALPAYADAKYGADPRLRRQGKSYVDTSRLTSNKPPKKANKKPSK
jgi:hypothetical protein